MASPAAAWFLTTLLFCACHMGIGDTTTHTYGINIFHTYTSDSSLLLRNPESCPCGLWLASSLGNLAAIVVMDRAAKDIMILWDLGLPLMLLQVGNRRSR